MEPGFQFGNRYTLIRRLGEGATKEVFLARDEVLQRDVALCVFKPQVLSGIYLERIRREARTLAGLSHPNIVGLYDSREDDGHYLVTEYIAGGNLKSKLASDWKDDRDLDEVLRIAIEVAGALAETHAKGIFHRDVKPSNVLLTKEGTAKLGDFGFAKPFGDDSISEENRIVGTIAYMSPEATKGLPPDSPSDMYSFGVMLFELVTGRRPFHGEDESVFVHHQISPPPPPTRYIPSCPPPLEALILRLLDKKPEARPTAVKAAAELRRVRKGGPARRYMTPTATVLVIVLAAGFIAWWAPWVWPDPPIPIEQVCEIDERLAYDISPGPAHAKELRLLYRISPDNKPLFGHLGQLRKLHRLGDSHRGITYIYGAPGVGKSFFVKKHLKTTLPADANCVVKLSDVFTGSTKEFGFQVEPRSDVTTSGGKTLGTLPAITDPRDFQLRRLLSASGCEQNGELVPLVVIDDIDEVHPDSSRLILRSLDKFLLDPIQPKSGFLHVIVVGGSEGFAPWYRHPKRGDGIQEFLSTFELKGPVYPTTGDLEVLARNVLEFQLGKAKWKQAQQSGTASSLVRQFEQYVRRHRFLSYSIRSLSIATMISDRPSTSPNATGLELKDFLLSELLRRASEDLGRPDPDDEQYRRVLEQVASRYANPLDDDGFFVVAGGDKVSVPSEGRDVDEVDVRAVLDHSGIAITIPESYSTARYRFEPVWVQAHLIELANQRKYPRHQIRSCSTP
jgi:tRNA A-37 threonylcarbamoyl transferase component Bud32